MIELLKRLIEADSTLEHGETAAAEVLVDYFRGHDLAAEVDAWDEKRANVMVVVRGKNSRPGLLFGSHMDVVPPGEGQWRHPPFQAVEEDGWIYGRGSTDMKGGLAASAAAVVEAAKAGRLQGDLVWAATAGEETDSCGVRRFVERQEGRIGPLAGIVVPEPTSFQLVGAHRGMVWIEVDTFGQTAHGSMPEKGVNAVWKMHRLMERLPAWQIPHTPDPLLGGVSVSLNQIAGGKAPNVVPDRCRIQLDVRVVPGTGPDQVIASLEKIAADLQRQDPEFRAEVRLVRAVEAFHTDPDCSFIQAVMSATGIDKTVAVGYTTDGPYFARLGAPLIIFGPGSSDVCHQPDERIRTADLETAKQHYLRIIDGLLR